MLSAGLILKDSSAGLQITAEQFFVK